MFQDFINDFLGTSGKKDVDSLIQKCGYAAAALTLVPIPGSEIIAVMPIHVGMVTGIAHSYGVELTKESALNIILQISATVGLSLVGSRIATTAAKIVLPGLGGLISAPFMYASTIALGAVAKLFFKNEGDVDSASMKDLYRESVKQAKREFDPEQMQDDEVKEMAAAASEESEDARAEETASPSERLGELKKLLDQELISQEEFDAAKEKILGEI